ncbi:3-deoxy-8-phosphooctulonate synthase [Desulfovibrio mangrovi]|uniref:3-deoxy-8-phosphooctulonate synthase n=1 Tax=Desulfovibrio mangrovi TaxID=2976983 RepID=UPI0022474F3A|nr:3-deoxy-8-phosphooctulonate synthase [Desulfovibrio mangrovi]UZP68247.1 3-deoxy-8-phosphooctulonate synthase [Desulfovibrio mangrovi]
MYAHLAKPLYDSFVSGPFVFAGPCALESFELALETAHAVKEAAAACGLTAVFKSSYDKANRTSLSSFRGPGMSKGLEWLARIKEETGLPVVTDIHEHEQAAPVAEVADILQIPAFLCRQTSLLQAAASTGRIINVKKGQFVAPWDMKPALDKLFATGNRCILLTERGASFGYNNLVVDFRSFPIMQSFGVPVVFDATHSVQLPGGQGGCSGGDRQYVPKLARAAVAAGVNGVFLECHPDPDKALCDGPNSWPLNKLAPLLKDLKTLWAVDYAC